MADTTSTVTQSTTVASGPTKQMPQASATMVGGVGASGVIAFFWNWYAVKNWGAPAMDVGTAAAVALTFGPLIAYGAAFLPSPRHQGNQPTT